MTDPSHDWREDTAPSKARGGSNEDDETETIVDPSAKKARLRIVAIEEFDVHPEEIAYYCDAENESDVFETLLMAHAMGVDKEHNVKLTFKVEQQSYRTGEWSRIDRFETNPRDGGDA